jgi:hypothetical protein
LIAGNPVKAERNRCVRYPFLGIGGGPDEEQVFDGGADVEFLRNDDHAGPSNSTFLEKPREVSRHCIPIMGNQNTTGFRGDPEHIRIADPHNTTIIGSQEIERRFSPAKAEHDLVVEVGIRLEARPHLLGV